MSSKKKTSSVDSKAFVKDRETMQALFEYAKGGNLEGLKKAVKNACEKGSYEEKDIVDGYQDANKRSLMHFAANGGRKTVVEYLLSVSDLKDAPDAHGDTPFLLAASSNKLACVKLLFAAGVNPNHKNDKGVTALHHAAAHGNLELLDFLLGNCSVDVSVGTKEGDTPLHWAAGEGRNEAVARLLSAGASAVAKNETGVAPIVMAVAHGCHECVKMLLQNGEKADVEVMGVAAVIMAAEMGHLPVVKVLLEAGADPNVKHEGLTACELAARCGHGEIAGHLLPLTTCLHSDGSCPPLDAFMSAQLEIAHTNTPAAPTPDPNAQYPTTSTPEQAATPENKAKALAAKNRGNEAFKYQQYEAALREYTEGINHDGTMVALWNNRSVCYLRMKLYAEALEDAQTARRLDPKDVKACFREGCAYQEMEKYEEAANSFWAGVQLDNGNVEVAKAFKEAIELGREQHQKKTATEQKASTS